MNANGSGSHDVTNSHASPDHTPDWSPDGTRIAFASTRDGFGNFGVWTMNADGSGQAQVPGTKSGTEPAWSPDGAHIAFDGYQHFNAEIYSVDPDGCTAVARLTNNAPPGNTLPQDFAPDWQPLAAPISSNPSGELTSLTPARVLDTRDGTGRNGVIAPLGDAATFDVQITGAGGVPSSGVLAVVLNATVTGPTAPSFLTVWPTGVNRPGISNLNYVPDQTVPNLVTVAVGAGGKVSVYNHHGSAHVIFDVVGFYASDTGNPGSRFHGVAPSRLFDTRDGTGGVAAAPVGEGGTLKFTVKCRGGVPKGVTTVVMNVTVTAPTADSFITVYPDDVARPLASNLNFVGGLTVPNLVIMRVPASGVIDFYNRFGNVHVIADVVGYFDNDKSTEAGRLITGTPVRVFDSRVSSPFNPPGSLPPGGTLILGNTSPNSGTIGAWVFNVTVTEPTAAGYVTVSPDPPPPPLASNLNFTPGQTVPNLVISRAGPTNARVDFYNKFGFTHLVVDVFGIFTNANTTAFSVQGSTLGAEAFTANAAR